METQIVIDVADWMAYYLGEEVAVTNEEEVIALSRKGYTTSQIAVMLISARLNAWAPDDILPPNKLLLLSGAKRQVAKMFEERVLPEINAREFIGRSIGDEDEEGYTKTMSHEGLRLAERYLLDRVPGHIMNHMKIVAANDGDVERIAGELKAKIDEIAAKVLAASAELEAA
jgi:hypothetical protein